MPWELRFFSDDLNRYNLVREWFESIHNIFESEIRDDTYIFSPESLDREPDQSDPSCTTRFPLPSFSHSAVERV